MRTDKLVWVSEGWFIRERVDDNNREDLQNFTVKEEDLQTYEEKAEKKANLHTKKTKTDSFTDINN